MVEYEPEVKLSDYLNVLWKRRWLIVIPTILLALIAGIVSFLIPPKWEVDAIIQPSKFFVQTEQGAFSEVVVMDPKQIAGQINQESYNRLISAELNLDPRKFPKLKAENLRDTKLVRVSIRTGETEKAQAILNSLFQHLKGELDRKIDVEIKSITTQVAAKENDIKTKTLDIQSKNIEIDKTQQEIIAAGNKLKISEERSRSLVEEMKGVKTRIDEIEKQQKTILAEKQGNVEALGLLLYSNEVQQNFRYYNTLEENLSAEKITQENLRLSMREKEQEIKDTEDADRKDQPGDHRLPERHRTAERKEAAHRLHPDGERTDGLALSGFAEEENQRSHSRRAGFVYVHDARLFHRIYRKTKSRQ